MNPVSKKPPTHHLDLPFSSFDEINHLIGTRSNFDRNGTNETGSAPLEEWATLSPLETTHPNTTSDPPLPGRLKGGKPHQGLTSALQTFQQRRSHPPLVLVLVWTRTRAPRSSRATVMAVDFKHVPALRVVQETIIHKCYKYLGCCASTLCV